MVFVRFGRMNGEIRVKKGDFGVILFFWACLGIGHPDHPYLGIISPKKRLVDACLLTFVWEGAPFTELQEYVSDLLGFFVDCAKGLQTGKVGRIPKYSASPFC